MNNSSQSINREEDVRIVAQGANTYVLCLDKPGPGNGCHQYEVVPFMGDPDPAYAKVTFQKGPIQESGVNGCQNEDLLQIVIDRLQCFQSGTFKCKENENALTKIEEGLMWLQKRTSNRAARGVEGKNKK